MKDTDKVTMTLGQIKKLIKESAYNKDGFIWTLNKIGMGKVDFIKDSDTIFDTADEALEDGMIELKKCPDGNPFEIIVTRTGMPTDDYRNIVKRATKSRSGKIAAFGLNKRNVFFDQVEESYDDDEDNGDKADSNFVWTISKAAQDEDGEFYEGDDLAQSKKGWDYPDNALDDLKRKLNTLKPGNYFVVIYDDNAEEMDPYIYDYISILKRGKVQWNSNKKMSTDNTKSYGGFTVNDVEEVKNFIRSLQSIAHDTLDAAIDFSSAIEDEGRLYINDYKRKYISTVKKLNKFLAAPNPLPKL